MQVRQLVQVIEMRGAADVAATTNVRTFPRDRLTDAELVAAVAQGDADALAAVWRRHAASVRATLYAALGPESAIDDLLQEVFTTFFRMAGRIQEPASLRAYLLGAAIRRATFERRTLGRRSRWLELFGRQRISEPAVQQPDVDGREAVRALQRVLDRVEERARMAFILRYVEGLPPREIALALETSEATAKRAIAKGRERVLLLASREPALADYLTTLKGGHHE